MCLTSGVERFLCRPRSLCCRYFAEVLLNLNEFYCRLSAFVPKVPPKLPL